MPGGLNPPPSVIASWPIPNYVDPPQRGPGVLIVTIIFTVLMLAATSARMWVRFFKTRRPGFDDYLILMAMVPALGLTASLCILNPLYGGFRHLWDTPIDRIATIQMLSWISQFLFHISTSLIKISVLWLYLRVIKGTANKVLLNVIRGVIALITAYFVSGIALFCLMCQPLAAYWEQFNFFNPPKDYTCWNQGILPMYSAGFNVFSDFLVTCLPMLLFVQLQMPKKEKIALSAVFGVGFIVCAAGVMRMYYSYRIFFRTYDATWVAYFVWIFAAIECHLGLVCASLPTLRPLFQRFLGTIYNSRSYPPKNSNSGDSGNSGISNNSSAPSGKPQMYPLQSYPRKFTTSNEWDKTSNVSGSVPLVQTSEYQQEIWRADTVEVSSYRSRGDQLPV